MLYRYCVYPYTCTCIRVYRYCVYPYTCTCIRVYRYCVYPYTCTCIRVYLGTRSIDWCFTGTVCIPIHVHVSGFTLELGALIDALQVLCVSLYMYMYQGLQVLCVSLYMYMYQGLQVLCVSLYMYMYQGLPWN